jgi:hypothetical protein
VHIPKGAPTATPEDCASSSPPNHNNLSTLSDKTAEDNDDEASSTVGAIEFDNNDPFSLILNQDDDPHIASLETDKAIHLLEINQFDAKAFRKKNA